MLSIFAGLLAGAIVLAVGAKEQAKGKEKWKDVVGYTLSTIGMLSVLLSLLSFFIISMGNREEIETEKAYSLGVLSGEDTYLAQCDSDYRYLVEEGDGEYVVRESDTDETSVSLNADEPVVVMTVVNYTTAFPDWTWLVTLVPRFASDGEYTKNTVQVHLTDKTLSEGVDFSVCDVYHEDNKIKI